MADPTMRFPNTLRVPDVLLSMLDPVLTRGRVIDSVKRGTSRLRETTASNAIAPYLPISLALTIHAALAVATDATRAKIAASPMSIGNVSRPNERSARENTSGIIGRMHGLRIVRMPPMYARNSKEMSY